MFFDHSEVVFKVFLQNTFEYFIINIKKMFCLLILLQTYSVLVINNVEDIITVFYFVYLIYKYFCPKISYIDSLY